MAEISISQSEKQKHVMPLNSWAQKRVYCYFIHILSAKASQLSGVGEEQKFIDNILIFHSNLITPL